MIYKLTEKGRALQWHQWQRIGGCGLANNAKFIVLRKRNTTTLGEIADACPFSGRSLARYAAKRLNRHDLAQPAE
jgi:hypothetical protein